MSHDVRGAVAIQLNAFGRRKRYEFDGSVGRNRVGSGEVSKVTVDLEGERP